MKRYSRKIYKGDSTVDLIHDIEGEIFARSISVDPATGEESEPEDSMFVEAKQNFEVIIKSFRSKRENREYFGINIKAGKNEL